MTERAIDKKKFIRSPLGYTGGKYKLLPDISANLPDDIEERAVYDVFCGGLNVGLNIGGRSPLHANDVVSPLVEMYRWLLATKTEEVIELVEKEVEKRGLSFHEEGKEPYLEMRAEYNKTHAPLLLLCLIFFSFNHMIRFNRNGEYNVSFGKNRSRYTDTTRKNLIAFTDRMKERKTVLTSKDFAELEIPSDAFVYCDPPYTLSLAAYNTSDKYCSDWSETTDKRLTEWLDKLDKAGAKWMLSDVLSHNGRKNETLAEWSKRYRTIHLEMDYSNSSYHKLAANKSTETDEVLIVNY